MDDSDDYLKCSKCESSHINELRDGRDLMELAITQTAMDGYDPASGSTQKLVFCVDCYEPLVRPLIDAGFPAWWVHGFLSEADALEYGWDPDDPYVNPFADEED